MDGFIITIGLLVLFYNLFKIVFNTIRVIFFKKKVKKFLKIDLVAELIYFLGWIVLMRNLVVLLSNQIFHSIVYCVAMLIFLINQKNKKIYDYILFSIIVIDTIIVLIILSMLKLYFLIVFVVIVYIFTITLLRKNKNKLKNCGYLALSLLDIANIFISYIALIAYAASGF